MAGTDQAPPTELHLAVFVGRGTDILTLDELLAAGRVEESFDAACLSLVVGGVEQWGPRLSFGPLDFLVNQLGQAYERLAAGRRAVLRGGGDDSPVSEFVVFDPHGGEEGGVTLEASVAATDVELGQGPVDDVMYAFVDEHLEQMQASAFDLRELAPVTVSTAAIVAALERESRTADALSRRGVDEPPSPSH